MARVFVTNARQRKSLAIIRSLGKRGIKVTAGEEYRFAPSFFSKYCHNSVVYPSPTKRPDLFIEWLVNHIKESNYGVIFPVDDDVLEHVVNHFQELSAYTKIPVVDKELYNKARDKAETVKIAMENGIPCPKTYFISNLEEVKALAESLDFPVVIKPRRSSGSRGLVYIQSKDELQEKYLAIHERHNWPLIQEFIPPGGNTYGVEALFNRKSEPKAVFVHRRLREYPPSGGPSTLRESVKNSDLASLGIRLLKALNWYGVAMVEFKIDPRTNEPKLMEVNPRFWGSLALPIYAGIDFPYLLYKLAMEGDVDSTKNYKVGLQCRWLVGDFLCFLKDSNKFHRKPSFFKFYDKDLKYDIISREDIKPTLGIFLFYALRFFDKEFLRERLFR